jgi:hypothetical protein
MHNLKIRFGFWFEALSVALAALGLYLLLAYYALGGPLSNDVMWYINAGMNQIKDTFILNRYFHVFMQAIFVELAPSPLVGHQHFWAFLISATSLTIYLGARNFSYQSGRLHGLFGLAIFFSIKALSETTGMALVDISAMFMVSLITLVYLFSLKQDHRSAWLIGLLGFLFFLAFKTKETTLITGLLIFGLGYGPQPDFKLSQLLKRLPTFALGGLLGLIFFMLLSGIFLGDFFFGMRPAEIRAFALTYVQGAAEAPPQPGLDTWYNGFFFSVLLFPFVLYLLSGARCAPDEQLSDGQRLVWLLPLALILFVSLTIGNQWGFLPRFIFPSLPLIAMLAPQFLELKFSSQSKDRLLSLGGLALLLAALVGLRLAIRANLLERGQDISVFLATTLNPIFLTLILGLSFFKQRLNLVASLLVLTLSLGILSAPLAGNLREMLQRQSNAQQTQRLFHPFATFAEDITYQEDMRFYSSQNVWAELNMSHFGKDPNEVASMFNLYFDARSNKDQYTLSTDPLEILAQAQTTDYNYILLSSQDWQTIAAQPTAQTQWLQKYQPILDPVHGLVLLKYDDQP